jgi:hypothetical protein
MAHQLDCIDFWRIVEQAHSGALGPEYRVNMDAQITLKARSGRPNSDLAAAVEEALAVAIEQGTRAAARFLTDHGAGFALTCRVLAEPDRRRAPLDRPPLGG